MALENKNNNSRKDTSECMQTCRKIDKERTQQKTAIERIMCAQRSNNSHELRQD